MVPQTVSETVPASTVAGRRIKRDLEHSERRGLQLRFLLRLVALCSTLLLWVVSAEAQTPSFTVSGRVVEKVHSTWIGGATVRLSGHPFFITDSDGRFRFTSVTPGLHTLTVEAMGYRSRQLELLARADTALLVEMEVDYDS